MNSDIYKEQIIDLYKNPINKGKLINLTNSAEKKNPSCGDEILISIKMNNNNLEEIKWQGVGCAICIASASLTTEEVKNKSKEEIIKLSETDVINLLNIPISPGRLNCALLPLQTIIKAIN